MKFLFITGQLNAGGAERVLLDILRHFDYEQHEVDLCQIVDGGTLADEIPSEVHRIPLWPDYTLGYRIALHLSLRCGVDFLIRKRMHGKLKKQYDVAISFLEGTPLRFHAIGRPAALRHVTWVHADLQSNPYEVSQFRSETEEQRIYAQMDRIVCVSEGTRASFCSRFPQVGHKTFTINNPIEVVRIQRMSTVKHVNPCDVVVVGRLTRTKGVDRALQALEILIRRGANLSMTIVGEGPERAKLERDAADLAIASHVSFTGYSTNPYPYMRHSKILLCPSRSESFCLAICEALALGVPVVATATTGARDLLEDSHYGLLSKHDPESIADAIQRLLSDERLMRQYEKEGPTRAFQFDIGNTMQSIYHL